MQTHTSKTKDSQISPLLSSTTSRKTASSGLVQITDNRPEAITQRKLYKMANSQSRPSTVVQFGGFQSKAEKLNSGEPPKRELQESDDGVPDLDDDVNFEEFAIEAEQQQPTAQQHVQPELRLLFNHFTIGEDDRDRNDKQLANHALNQLLERGKEVGMTAGPSPAAEANAIAVAQNSLGGGGGDYIKDAKAEIPELIQMANNAGYDITDERICKIIGQLSLGTCRLGFSTQIGEHQGGWRGGGFK